MSTNQLCKSENNMNISNNIYQASSNHLKEIEPETIRLKREEGGGGGTIIIQTMSQTQQFDQNKSMDRPMDHDEKKMRRQIANSNERRRMQSINAGFQSLRSLLPHHDGEKLSKAAILQQTADHMERLEHEKQQLVAQAQHLQRLMDSLGNNNNNNNDCPQQQIIQQTITSSPSTGGAIKKRKLDQVMTVQTVSDSSDEGLGSMSPEPVSQMLFSNGASTITKTHMVSHSATSVTTINVKDYVNLQNQMETERRHRIQLEEQLKQLEMQFYSSNQIPVQKYHQIQSHEEVDEVDGHVGSVIEEKIIVRQAGSNDEVHYISNANHHPQYVVVNTNTPGSSPKHIIINDDDDNSRTLSSDELHKDEVKMIRHKMSPKHYHLQQREARIPSILEQAIKAEPKVEVERINSPCIQLNIIEEAAVQSPPRNNSPPSVNIRTTYPNNNHRPNLETIVEAIRQIEGDAFDMDDGQVHHQTSETPATQEVPLALTTGNKYQQSGMKDPQPFLKFRHNATSQSGLPTFSLSVPSQPQQQQQQQQQQQPQYQQRPGVIVVKQSS